jgi:hypothetical protein
MGHAVPPGTRRRGNLLAIKKVNDRPYHTADNYAHYRQVEPTFRDDGPVAFQAIEYCVGSHGICWLALMPEADAQLQGLLPQCPNCPLHLL